MGYLQVLGKIDILFGFLLWIFNLDIICFHIFAPIEFQETLEYFCLHFSYYNPVSFDNELLFVFYSFDARIMSLI